MLRDEPVPSSSLTWQRFHLLADHLDCERGVRYILEGSVRRAAQSIRIKGQLIDATTGGRVWADRFDGKLADIFTLQDDVTARVVGAFAPNLRNAEIEQARRKPIVSLTAYAFYLRALYFMHRSRQ